MENYFDITHEQGRQTARLDVECTQNLGTKIEENVH